MARGGIGYSVPALIMFGRVILSRGAALVAFYNESLVFVAEYWQSQE